MSAFNGSGTYVISGTGLPYVTGTTISSTVANQLNTDLATGLSTAICKDGQTTPTANIPMGGFKFTGLAAGTGTGNSVNYTQWIGGNTPGSVTNDNASAGSIGEFTSASATGVALSTGVTANITSISLTAGDWDVSGIFQCAAGGGGTATSYSYSVNSVSATLGTLAGGNLFEVSAAFTVALGNLLPISQVRFSLSTTTTIYLVGAATFAAGTQTAAGFIRARRAR